MCVCVYMGAFVAQVVTVKEEAVKKEEENVVAVVKG